MSSQTLSSLTLHCVNELAGPFYVASKALFTNCDTHTNELLSHFLTAWLISQHCAIRFPLCRVLPPARSRQLITHVPCGLQEQKRAQVLCHSWVCLSCPKEPGWSALPSMAAHEPHLCTGSSQLLTTERFSTPTRISLRGCAWMWSLFSTVKLCLG